MTYIHISLILIHYLHCNVIFAPILIFTNSTFIWTDNLSSSLFNKICTVSKSAKSPLLCCLPVWSCFSWFVHPSRLSKDLPFIVKGIWTVKMSAPENVLEKEIAVQTHFCGSFMNHGTSGCLWLLKSILHCWR